MNLTLPTLLGCLTIAACYWLERYGLYAVKDVARAIRGWRR